MKREGESMGTFKIYFFGLVAHIGETDTEKEFAAVVKAPGHHRYILWDRGGVPLTDAVKRIAFKFGGAFDARRAEPDNLFREYVPRLKSLMGGDLEFESELSKHAIKVEYPASVRTGGGRDGSTLSVAQLYEHQAVHIAGGRIVRPLNCVARVTVLTVERADDEGEMEVYAIGASGAETHLKTIQSGECLLISSQTADRDSLPFPLPMALRDSDHDEHSASAAATGTHAHTASAAAVGTHIHPAGTHVQHYAAIVREQTPVVVVGEAWETGECNAPDDIACSWIRGVIDIDLMTGSHGECGNTSWP